MMDKKILIVDDEEDLCEILQFNLESEGFLISIAHSAEEALTLPLTEFDLILLDVMMGGMSGFKFANKLKTELKLSTPIIFLSAKNTENDTLTGFNVGADDYIAKPFSIKEVIARSKAVINRSAIPSPPPATKPTMIKVDELTLDLTTKKVMVGEIKVEMTRKEFEILALLVQNEGRIFTRNEILTKVWSMDVIVVNRTVDVNIARIRKKIGIIGKKIKSRSGYGYCFDRS
ncbi:MAG: response regulator transcription factor [Saprospiraceae bacterium]